jgi:hypothetical protein
LWKRLGIGLDVARKNDKCDTRAGVKMQDSKLPGSTMGDKSVELGAGADFP